MWIHSSPVESYANISIDIGTNLRLYPFNNDVSQMQSKMDELESKLRAADAVNEKKKKIPYLANVNEDPMLSNVVVHFIEKRQFCYYNNKQIAYISLCSIKLMFCTPLR